MEKSFTKKFPIRDILLFIGGGVGYYSIEVMFRGFSHWTMGICGGICMLGVYDINKKCRSFSYGTRALLGALLITAVEFLTGYIVNIRLGWNVWSYSHIPLNLLGQISLLFSCIWYFMSLGACLLISVIERKIMRKRKELSP